MSGTLSSAVWLLPVLPLLGAAVLLLAGRRSDAWGHLLGCATALVSFALGVVFFVDMLGRDAAERVVHQTLFSWVPVGELQVDFGLQLDQLDRKSTRQNSSHYRESRMPSSA